MAKRDYRSPEAAAYRKLYKDPRWPRLRDEQLEQEPFCRYCRQRGITTAATIVDHETPHRGDPYLFFNGPLISLCKPCHDGPAQKRDRTGLLPGCAADGMPLDPGHPWG